MVTNSTYYGTYYSTGIIVPLIWAQCGTKHFDHIASLNNVSLAHVFTKVFYELEIFIS